MIKNCGLVNKYMSDINNMKNYTLSEFIGANCKHSWHNCSENCEYYIKNTTVITLNTKIENRIREIAREEILKFMQQPVSISTQVEASKIHIHDLKN